MFNIDISGVEVCTVIAITDLTSDDTAKFRQYEPLTTDDCIAVHQGLRQFDGDLLKALK